MKKAASLLILLILLLSQGCTKETTKEKADVSKPEATKKIVSTDFEDPQICKGCHPEIYEQWQGTMHSLSHTDVFYDELFKVARKETNGAIDTFCAGCHTPIGVISGEIPPAEGPQISEIAKKGLQCDFCHTISGSKGIGNGAYISTPGNIKFGPFSDSYSSYHESQFSELHTKSEFCGMCHDVSHPTNGLPLETTYKEWKEGPYSKEGIQCQDCHMNPEEGTAANGGPKRAEIFTHRMVGGNLVITDNEQVKEAVNQRLKRAAKVEIELPSPLKKGQDNKIAVKVTNVGAGHYIPTGLTEARQVWLEIIAKDEQGKIIYHNGSTDAAGKVDENAVMYNVIVADKNGNPTLKFWNAEKKIKDYRIPPRQSVTEKYSIQIPAEYKGKLNLEAVLNYRSAPQEEIDGLMGDKAIKFPIIEMAKATLTVNVQ